MKINPKSQIPNPKSKWCIGKDSNFHSETATVLQTACLSPRRPMREKLVPSRDGGWVSIKKILCKNEKGRDLGTLQAQKCVDKEPQDFNLFENSPKYRKLKSFQTLCLFPFLSGAFCPSAASSLNERRQNLRTCFRLFSCQISSKTRKERRLFQSLSRTFASPLLKQFLSSTTR